MSIIFKSFLIALSAVIIYVVYHGYSKVPEKEPILEEKWWGKGAPEKESHEISKTRIDISDDVIKDLYYRLHHTEPFHPSLENVNQFYGTHTTLLNKVLDYWKHKYNWTERQEYLNQYPHYYVTIRGLRIHFLHIKPKTTTDRNGKKLKILPLIILHGWPGSFREFYGLIPKLIEPRADKDFVFELIIPSLPGFTFSQHSGKPGLSAAYMAQIFADLMQILGFDRYYVQGGDWGSVVAQQLAIYYAPRVIGIHSNMCFVNTLRSNFMFLVGRFFPSLIYEAGEDKLCNSTANSINFLVEETGYFHLQSTKPDTIGVALRDSPMGLAAYMLEKFSTLTNAEYRHLEDGGITEKFTMDQLLDNVMLYWVSGCMTSAMRIYAEAITNARIELKRFPVKVPSGCARFPYEILLSPRSILEEIQKNLIHLTIMERGGHFAALEEPNLMAHDIFLFVEKVQHFRKN